MKLNLHMPAIENMVPTQEKNDIFSFEKPIVNTDIPITEYKNSPNKGLPTLCWVVITASITITAIMRIFNPTIAFLIKSLLIFPLFSRHFR